MNTAKPDKLDAIIAMVAKDCGDDEVREFMDKDVVEDFVGV